MLDYASKMALAPMVRVSELPVRLLSLKYGADLVWGPEIVDKKLIQCKRVLNESINCVDFVEYPASSGDSNGSVVQIKPDKSLEYQKKVVFRTFPQQERGKLVFQLGTACPKLAVQAAKIVAKDVDAIDLNSGCPKHFSIHSGMGAGLLKTPDKLVAILEALVTEVGKPFGISISVKIRILDTVDETLALVKRLVATGVSCLTVHCRTTIMRPREPVIRDALSGIASICHEAGVACYVNGDVQGRWQLQELQNTYGVDGAMIARAAEANPSCFQSNKSDLISSRRIALELTKTAIEYDMHPSGLKYCLMKVVLGKDPVYQLISRARTSEEHLKILTVAVEEEMTKEESSKGAINVNKIIKDDIKETKETKGLKEEAHEHKEGLREELREEIQEIKIKETKEAKDKDLNKLASLKRSAEDLDLQSPSLTAKRTAASPAH